MWSATIPKAIGLLREAVALDSNFAEGWRKLAVAIRNSGGYAPSAADSAIRRAYALSGRMTERERDAVLGYYYQCSPGYDREKAMAAYERMLARGDSSVALVNLGVLSFGRRDSRQGGHPVSREQQAAAREPDVAGQPASTC